MHLEQLPVLVFNAGRPADHLPLLEELLSLLAEQGLKIALKVVEKEGGAELETLCRGHDLVLLVGKVEGPATRVLLRGPEPCPALPAAGPWELVVPWESERVALLVTFIRRWLPKQWLRTPLYGGVVIGGQSRRMGRPKHLIRQDGRTWLERTAATLSGVVEQVVVIGAGEVPGGNFLRLPDLPGVAGPLAGLAAAMRWRPWVSWLLVACDLPDLDQAALAWLVAARRPGVWAVVPQVVPDRLEPLLAYYDFRAQAAVEALLARGEPRIRLLAAAEKAVVLTPPPELWASWRNVNYAHELG